MPSRQAWYWVAKGGLVDWIQQLHAVVGPNYSSTKQCWSGCSTLEMCMSCDVWIVHVVSVWDGHSDVTPGGTWFPSVSLWMSNNARSHSDHLAVQSCLFVQPSASHGDVIHCEQEACGECLVTSQSAQHRVLIRVCLPSFSM